MGQGRIDVEGLLGGAPLLPLGHDRQGAHVVQAVRELDQEHPPVARHCNEHLADGGGLLGLFRVELETVELGDAVDDPGHDRPETAFDVLEGDAGVLDGVVEQGGGHRVGVEAEARHDGGDGDGMGDVGLARTTVLPGMGEGRHLCRGHNPLDALVGVPERELAEHGLEHVAERVGTRLVIRHPCQGYHPSTLPDGPCDPGLAGGPDSAERGALSGVFCSWRACADAAAAGWWPPPRLLPRPQRLGRRRCVRPPRA